MIIGLVIDILVGDRFFLICNVPSEEQYPSLIGLSIGVNLLVKGAGLVGRALPSVRVNESWLRNMGKHAGMHGGGNSLRKPRGICI